MYVIVLHLRNVVDLYISVVYCVLDVCVNLSCVLFKIWISVPGEKVKTKC
jgi:hypothetical protein